MSLSLYTASVGSWLQVSDEDILNITHLCDQILDMYDYRAQLYDYLKNRMYAVAPNLTVLVGELIGARLISHAGIVPVPHNGTLTCLNTAALTRVCNVTGSLMNLAKHPSSTVQILGAEKALFRALKTKHDTPKYGLIYHAALVGQSNQKVSHHAPLRSHHIPTIWYCETLFQRIDPWVVVEG